MSETFKYSGGTFGINADEVGWGTLMQVNDFGGDCTVGCCDGDLAHTLIPLKATRDLSEDDERGGVVSWGAELVGETS